jgi:cytochrome P450
MLFGAGVAAERGESTTMTWTRITDPEQAVGPLPVWFGTRMIGLRGRFGLVLTTGDILRITSITALPESPHGAILLDVLLDLHDETGSPMPDKTVRDELTTMLIGGHETTTQTLSWVLYHLAKNKKILLRVRAENDVVMGDDLPAYPAISKLAYTRQVIYEAMRCYPSLWILARKSIEDDTLKDFPVPSGSNILINLYGLHHHPAYWDNPDIFDPDRFAPSLDEKRPPFVFIPFSVAPRSCIGSNFAMMEMLIVVTRIAKMFDLEVPAGYVPKIEPDTTLKAGGGIQLIVKKVSY